MVYPVETVGHQLCLGNTAKEIGLSRMEKYFNPDFQWMELERVIYLIQFKDAPTFFLGMMWGEVDLEEDSMGVVHMAPGRKDLDP